MQGVTGKGNSLDQGHAGAPPSRGNGGATRNQVEVSRQEPSPPDAAEVADSSQTGSIQQCRLAISRLDYQFQIFPSEVDLEQDWPWETVGEFARHIALAIQEFAFTIAQVLVHSDLNERLREFCSELLATVQEASQQYSVVLLGAPAQRDFPPTEHCRSTDKDPGPTEVDCELPDEGAELTETQAILRGAVQVIDRCRKDLTAKLQALDLLAERRQKRTAGSEDKQSTTSMERNG